MKRLFQLIVLLLPFFYMFDVFSGCCPEGKEIQKVYVSPQQLGISSEGVFVNLDNQWVKTDSLFSDEHGIYIQNLWPQEDGCREGYVPCRSCDRCVKWYYNICPLCNNPV